MPDYANLAKPVEPSATRAEAARRAQQRQTEQLAAATAEYRRLNPYATGNKLAASGAVNRIVAAAINADPPMVLVRTRCVTPCLRTAQRLRRLRSFRKPPFYTLGQPVPVLCDNPHGLSRRRGNNFVGLRPDLFRH